MPKVNYDLQTNFEKLLSAYSNMFKYIIYNKIVQEGSYIPIMTDNPFVLDTSLV
jgi:hypothetical protein